MAAASAGPRPLGPGAGDTPVDLDAFCSWLGEIFGAVETPSPGALLEELLGGDELARLRLIAAFDAKTEGCARRLAEIHGAATVRDLHLHYLYVLSLPLEVTA